MKIKTERLKSKVLEMLSKREYAKEELKEKVLAWVVKQRGKTIEVSHRSSGVYTQTLEEEAAVETVLTEFEERGWLSDERYIESYLNQKAYRFGERRLKQELQQKGVSESLISEQLEALKESEYERAREVWGKKYNKKPEDAKTYAKQLRFLVYRGFSPSLSQRVIRGSEETD